MVQQNDHPADIDLIFDMVWIFIYNYCVKKQRIQQVNSGRVYNPKERHGWINSS